MEDQNNQKVSKKRVVMRNISYALAAGIIFLVGFGIGSNRIILSKNQLFNKSEQKNLPANLDYTSVNEVYQKLKNNFDGQLDGTKLLDGIKAGLASAAGDPYTEYMNKDEAKAFNDQLDGTFSGIGAQLSKDDKGNIIVIAPIAGTPADKAGLKPKDIIAQIDGNSTSGMSIDDAVGKIRGDKGTHVKLKLIRNQTQQIDVDIIRDDIKVPSVTSKILDGNIGYLQITQFSNDTSDLATQAANQFKQANVKAVILDLRSDPGGLLDAAVNVSSLWLDSNKTVLQEKRGDTVVHTYTSTGTDTLKGLPTVVLINDGSASASEITAAALHDNGVAKLIGIKSFGKGSVQELDQLVGGGVLKVTIAHWYTPGGININKEGIKPDTEIKMSDDDVKAGRDPQLDAAKTVLAH